MELPLSSIAAIQSGVVLSRKETDRVHEAFKYKRLNLRALNLSGRVDHNELGVFLSREKIPATHQTQHGDIIIRLFFPLFPTVIAEEDSGLVVPSQLAIIRLHDDTEIIPDYLQYCLSRQVVSDSLLTTESSVQRTITVKSISNISIPIVPVGTQMNIKNIFSVSSQRTRLYQKLIEQEELQTTTVIESMIRGTLK